MNNFAEVHEGKTYYCFFDRGLKDVQEFGERNGLKFRFPTEQEAELILSLHTEIESVLLNEAMKYPNPFNIDVRRKENIRMLDDGICVGLVRGEVYKMSVAILMVVVL